MTLSKYDEAMADYLNSISLSETQASRIESALKQFSALMLTAYGDPEIYAQGSYATDTLVKPLTHAQSDGNAGEFDIDIVVERSTWEGATASLESIEETLDSDGIHSGVSIDKTKPSCVRVDYADDSSGVGFHVDIVPTRPSEISREVPIREDNEWKPSDAKSFADWFNGLCEEQPKMRQVTVILKRLRDINSQTNNLKSITVLTLVAKYYNDNSSLMGDLVSVLDEINTLMKQTKPVIKNPVNTSEDLMDGVEDVYELKKFINTIATSLDDALAENDGKALEELFGHGFKAPKATPVNSMTATPLVAATRAYAVDPE